MQAATATPQDLAHYAANPAALAEMTDEQIDALAATPAPESAESETGDTKGSEATPTAASQDANQDPAAQEATPTAAPTDASKPEGVVLKDGKHIAPYSVLERERERAARAEATVQALTDEVKRLQSGTAGTTEAKPIEIQLSDEDLESLDQDLPGVAKIVRAQMAMIDKLTGTVQTLQKGHEVQEQSAEQSRKDQEEVAIAASPTLTALRANIETDPKAAARWNRIADAYESLREDPDFFHLDTGALINKAEASITALYGPLTAAATEASAPAASPATPKPAALQAKADAAISAAAAASTAPRSSSDIPGGTAPPVDELAALADKSGAQLTAEFMKLTPEQIEAKLNRLR